MPPAATTWRSPLELDTDEARDLLGQIAAFGGARLPHLIITGGDPLQREDLFELIAHGRSLGLTISVTPEEISRTPVRRGFGVRGGRESDGGGWIVSV